MFFTPFIFGGSILHQFRGRKPVGVPLHLCAVGGGVTTLFLLYHVRFFSLWCELLLAVFCTVTIPPLMLALFQDKGQNESSPQSSKEISNAGCIRGCLYALLLLALFVSIEFSAFSRVLHAQHLAEDLEGLVVYKYRSRNHAQPTIVVSGSHGKDTLEGVYLPAWDVISSGKSMLKKPAWSAFGTIDGVSYRIVQREGFLAKLPDD